MSDSNPQLLSDIRLDLLEARFRPVYAPARDERRVTVRERSSILKDLGRISGRANLGQAIMLRLLTPRGELAALGHPEYGSRIHELVGQPNTENSRLRLRLFILESLAEERRIARVVEAAVTPGPGGGDRVEVHLRVLPIGEREVLDLGPFTLEL